MEGTGCAGFCAGFNVALKKGIFEWWVCFTVEIQCRGAFWGCAWGFKGRNGSVVDAGIVEQCFGTVFPYCIGEKAWQLKIARSFLDLGVLQEWSHRSWLLQDQGCTEQCGRGNNGCYWQNHVEEN